MAVQNGQTGNQSRGLLAMGRLDYTAHITDLPRRAGGAVGLADEGLDRSHARIFHLGQRRENGAELHLAFAGAAAVRVVQVDV